ncbi:MAG: signal recognition particle subunit [Desulfonauticus sp.]|jgi:signal recognition particle subunit SRP54|nr:signal recognition particle subunit [Desulfonauticus sp.]
MFDNLSERLDGIFRKIKGRGRLDESSIEEGLREVRLALLEADVNYKVVRDFTAKVKEKALGKEVLKSLTPGQQVVKIVHEELIELLGGSNVGLNLTGLPPHIIMLVGLQGSGKTTSAAKLALFLRRQKFSPYLVPADVYRPAAIEQLHKLAQEINMPVFPSRAEMSPVDICLQAVEDAKSKNCDVLILDTAGRLHIDEVLMNELVEIKKACSPKEILFVADAMTGQDAVNVASRFNELLDITGVILTKMEGDARGGAALSIKSVTGKPIKFIGVGEKLKDLEIFHPDRVASRILGMGDILTLIEKAQSSIDEKEATKLEEKIKTAKFDLEDFRTQMRRIRKLGSIEGLLKLIPGMGKLRDQLKNVKIPEKEMVKIEAIINSMTQEERRNPKIINASRKERIAKGSGTTVQDVNALLKNFEQMRKMMQQMMGQMGGGRRLGNKTERKVDRKKLKAKRKKLKKKKKK